MKGVIKGVAPASLTEWLALANDEWTPTYADFRGTPKHETHDALLAEQGGVCVYCGRGLLLDRSDSHIEHFRPQTSFNAATPPDLTLTYSNLVVSCGPNSLPVGHPDRRPTVCGEAKDDWFDDALHVDPVDPTCMARFSYGTSGLISTKVTPDDAATKMIQILNLNDETLRYERGILLSGIESDIAEGLVTAANKDQEIAQFLTLTEHGTLPSWGHVAVRYLQDEL